MTPLVQIKINKNYDYVKYDPFGATVNAFILDVYESQTEPIQLNSIGNVRQAVTQPSILVCLFLRVVYLRQHTGFRFFISSNGEV